MLHFSCLHPVRIARVILFYTISQKTVITMTQSSTSHTAWKGFGWKTRVFSLKTILIQDLLQPRPNDPKEHLQREDIAHTTRLWHPRRKYEGHSSFLRLRTNFPHNKFGFNKKGLSSCPLQPADSGKWKVASTTTCSIRTESEVKLRRKSCQDT